MRASERLQVRLLSPRATPPAYATDGAAGLDLSACIDEPLRLQPGRYAAVPTGIAIALPRGYEGQVRPRSGLAARHGVTVLNAPGTVDADYRGEIKVLLINQGREPYTLGHGDRIAQLIVAAVVHVEVEQVDGLAGTERGDGGFGSTGR